MPEERVACISQLLPGSLELGRAIAEQLPQVLLRLLELAIGDRELVGALAVLVDEARGLDGDRHLVGEGPQRRQLALEVRAGAMPGLDVERTDGLAGGSQNRHAGDRPEHHLMDRGETGQACILARAQADHRLTLGDHLLGDGARELRMGFVATTAARGVHAERTIVLQEQHESPLGAQQVHGVVRHAHGQPIEIELTRKLRVDLQDPGQAVLERRGGDVQHGSAGRGQRGALRFQRRRRASREDGATSSVSARPSSLSTAARNCRRRGSFQ